MTLQSDFTAFLSKGELHVQKCGTCGALNMYPQVRCPHCYSTDLGWRQASGTGTLLSHTIVRAAAPTAFQGDTPYAIGIVRLDEGPQMMCRLHPDQDGDFLEYRCDQPVRFSPVAPEEIARRPVAWFARQ